MDNTDHADIIATPITLKSNDLVLDIPKLEFTFAAGKRPTYLAKEISFDGTLSSQPSRPVVH